jgi:ADP-ribose pyrophosphatase YjhB (NUDIX family)
MSDARSYPARPYLAASAAIVRDGKILVVRRARPPAHGLFTLPGGVVEVGETLAQAVVREVSEETGMTIEPVALAGFRETIVHDAQTRVERHLSFCALPRAGGGEPVLNEELSEVRWIDPAEPPTCRRHPASPRSWRRRSTASRRSGMPRPPVVPDPAWPASLRGTGLPFPSRWTPTLVPRSHGLPSPQISHACHHAS